METIQKSVMRHACKDDSISAQDIQVQSADVAGLKRRMAKLFPELVRSQQQGKWCVSRSLLAVDSAASECPQIVRSPSVC